VISAGSTAKNARSSVRPLMVSLSNHCLS